MQLSCRWRQRRTVESQRNRRPHHVEQNTYAAPVIQPLERAYQVGKWAPHDTDRLPGSETTLEKRQAGFVAVLEQRFDDALRRRDGPSVAAE